MKRNGLIMLGMALFISANVSSQTVTLSGKNIPLKKIFAAVRAQTGFVVFYNESMMANTKPLTLNVKAKPLNEFLDEIFRDEPLNYSIQNQTVILRKKKEQSIPQPPDVMPALVNINGKITDSLGNPLVGASVIIKGSNTGTTTNNKGDFILNSVKANPIILISYTGYSAKLIQVKSGDPINISLAKNVSPLDEIQVIAYGSTTKRLNTGDQTTVTSKEIEQQPVSNTLEALAGRVPGMDITQVTGLPGSAVIVQIRGQNSIASGNEPLYIVDGVPYGVENNFPSVSSILGSSSNSSTGAIKSSGSPFSYLNPSDIESIDILKDADATAIYGTRGANGVVLITTKKGKVGQTRIEFNVQTGFGKVAETMKLLNTSEYLEMRHEAFKNDNAKPNPNIDYDITLWDTTRYTDWQKQLIGGIAQFTDAQTSVSGGNMNTQFLIGAGYNKQTNVFPGDFNNQRGSIHFNINNTSPNQKFHIQLSGMYVINDNHLPGYNLTQQALTIAPDAPPLYNSDGSINWALNNAGFSSWPVNNPAALLLVKYHTKTNNLIGNSVLSYNILSGLDVHINLGYTNIQTNEIITNPLTYFQPALRSSSQRLSDFGNDNFHSWIVEPQMTYSHKIGDGSMSALLGMNIEQNFSNGEYLEATGFTSDLLLQDIGAATNIKAMYVTDNVYKYNAIFGRFNYNWQSKYLFNFTARRDGSSRFGPANQFHNFGAIGAAWIFSKENIVQQSIRFLSFGKLRGSFGTTGNDQVGDYSFMDLYGPISVGNPYQGSQGLSPSRIYTPNLSWEETKKLEGGIELGFVHDRIYLSASYYRNRSSDQLLMYQLPSITGFSSISRNLPATVQNQGWEFELKTVNLKTRYFSWTSSFNLSLNRNELISGSQGISDYYIAKIGHPLTSTFVYHSLGVNPFTGLYQFSGSQENPTSTPGAADANFLIDVTPKFYGGFQNSLTYKAFQLDILFQFRDQPNFLSYFASSQIPGTFNNGFGGNQPSSVLNRWQNPGDVKPFERFSQNQSTSQPWLNAATNSNLSYSNASYIRLKNISLSWQMPNNWFNHLHIKNGWLYFHGQNLLTYTNYKGLDPETGSTALPVLKVYTAGIKVGF